MVTNLPRTTSDHSPLLINLTGTVKLNTDGSCKEGRRSGRGEWVSDFYGKVHICQVLEGEIQAIYTGLGIIKSLNGMRIVVELDSLMAVNLLNGPKNLNHPLAPLVEDCKVLLQQTMSNIKYIMREGNKVADLLAKLGAEKDEDLKILKDPILEV